MRIIIFLLFIPVFSFCQLAPDQEAYVDSLKLVIDSEPHDTIKINALREWDDLIYRFDPELDLSLNLRVLQLCEESLNHPEIKPHGGEKTFLVGVLSSTLNTLGLIYDNKGDYQTALDYHFRSIEIKEAELDTSGLAASLSNIGLIYISLGEFDMARDNVEKSLELGEILKDTSCICTALLNLGLIDERQSNFKEALEKYNAVFVLIKGDKNSEFTKNVLSSKARIYHEQGDYAKAIQMHHESLKMSEELQDKRSIAASFNSIARVHYEQKSLEKAISFLDKGLQIQKEIGNKQGQASILNNIGLIYQEKESDSLALNYFVQSYEIRKEIGNTSQIPASLVNIGTIHRRKGDYDKALSHFKEALKLYEKQSKTGSISGAYSGIAQTYLDQKNYSQAIYYGEKAYSIAKEMSHPKLTVISTELLHSAYKGAKNYRQAMLMHEEFIEKRDSLESEKNERAVIKQEYKNEYDKQAVADSIQYAQEQVVVKVKLEKEEQKSNFLFVGMGLALLFGGFIFNRFRVTNRQKKTIENQKQTVEQEKEKSDRLLLNILPKDTAEELKEKGSVSAKHYPIASVLFTDFKGFSEISEKLAPEKLVKELDDCFSAFDNIVEKYDVEKIKTIGDAYMAVGGIPIITEKHVENVLNAAFEIREHMNKVAIEKRKNSEPFFEIRIGMHSGPLVTGVVGTKKFQYDVWGDTVNVASRMESNSEPGKINVSESTYQLLKNNENYIFTPRGEIDVKGKGNMKMYFVEATS
jgi:class 3 adenylate cyclase/lipopolysaccharide biosynthesis regulator YciM